MRRSTKYEVSTKGFDPRFQAVGTGPGSGATYVGIPVPIFAGPGVTGRYLFMLANAQFGAHRRARLVGIRTMATILAQVAVPPTSAYFLEKVIRNPVWAFQDANISWHLRQVNQAPNIPVNPLNRADSAQDYAVTPALLYRTIDYAGVYSPPSIQGEPLIGDLGTWHDLRFPWETSNAWSAVDMQFSGPCHIALYASVKQTNPALRTPLAIPAGGTNEQFALTTSNEEDLFVSAYPQAIYGRVAGSLIFEEEEVNTEDPPRGWP
jgi:hypothetical protein